MPSLRKVAAKECLRPSCPRHGQRLDPHEGFCEACGEPLAPVFGWNPRPIVLALGATLAAVLVTCGPLYYLAHRPRPLTDDVQRRLASWVKEADRDRVVTPGEKAA